MHNLLIITGTVSENTKPRRLSWLAHKWKSCAISALMVIYSPLAHRLGHLRKLSIKIQRGKLLITYSMVSRPVLLLSVFCFFADISVLFSSLLREDRKYAASDHM